MPVPNRSARLVAWSNAVALGLASPDLAATEVVGVDGAHRVDGIPGTDDVTMPVLLAMVRRTGEPTARLLLPVPGDPAGLPGPGPLAAAALLAGEVALLPDVTGTGSTGWGLVPDSSAAAAVRWTAYPLPAPAPGPAAVVSPLAEADRELAESLREATALLDQLDAGAWEDRDVAELAALRSGRLDGDGLAPGYPERAVSVLVRARRLRTIVRLASQDDGGALTAADAAVRRAALAPLDRAARHAEMAAYNTVADQHRGMVDGAPQTRTDEPRPAAP